MTSSNAFNESIQRSVPADQRPGSAPLRVLVVDDEPEMRLMLSLILEQSGCRLAFAGSVAEARSCLLEAWPDLVLLDIGLGGQPEGLELCDALKQAAPGPFPVVVMLTADDSPRTVVAARERGADGYVVKPFTPTQILGLIDSFDAWRIDAARKPPSFWPAPRFLR